jgi:protein SCO1
VVLLVAAGCGAAHRSQQAAAPAEAGLRGLVPSPLPSRPSFTLTDTAGHPFSFAARTQGRLTYLYFGYTHCPDVCPLTMANIAAALRTVRPEVRRRIEVVFVAVDPGRDSRRRLRSWLGHFNRSFVGLTGSERAISAAAAKAGVPLPPPPKNQTGLYGVDHSAFVFPYSPDGLAHVVYAQGFQASDYAHDMPLLLKY